MSDSPPFVGWSFLSLDDEARELATTLARDELLESIDLRRMWRDWFLSNTASKQFTWSREYARLLIVYCRALEMAAEEERDPSFAADDQMEEFSP